MTEPLQTREQLAPSVPTTVRARKVSGDYCGSAVLLVRRPLKRLKYALSCGL